MIDGRLEIPAEPGEAGWWEVDREILECLAGQSVMSVADIANRLHLSEGEASSLLAMLAREGKVRICQVMLAA